MPAARAGPPPLVPWLGARPARPGWARRGPPRGPRDGPGPAPRPPAREERPAVSASQSVRSIAERRPIGAR
eukprot:555991-Prorocentrum_minimum.AAC.1